MDGYEPAMSFDRHTADWYATASRGDEASCVAFLADRAGGGPVLELAIGTGRIALPLAARGLRVDGVDIAEPMLEHLRSHPGSVGMNLVQGDLADVPFDDRYRLVYVVWNSFFNLLSQDEQVRCFRNVADRLAEGGLFVLESEVPGRWYRRDGSTVEVDSVELDGVQLGVWRHDPVSQTLEGNHVRLTTAGIRSNPIVQRYAWPAELDLMGRLSGLRLHERWAGWDGRPFTADAENCISVYGR